MPTVPPDAPGASCTETDIKEKRNLLFKGSICYDQFISNQANKVILSGCKLTPIHRKRRWMS